MYAGYTTEQLPSHEEHANVGTLVAQSEKQGDIPAWADIAINQTSINEHQVILGRTTEQGLKDTDYWQDDDSELMLKDDSILTDAMFGNVTDSLVSPQVVTSLESSCDPKEIPEDLTHAIDIGGIHLGASIEDVEKVLVHTFDSAARLSKKRPVDTEEAQYNIAWPVASAIVHGEVGYLQMCDAAVGNESVLAIMGGDCA